MLGAVALFLIQRNSDALVGRTMHRQRLKESVGLGEWRGDTVSDSMMPLGDRVILLGDRGDVIERYCKSTFVTRRHRVKGMCTIDKSIQYMTDIDMVLSYTL